MMTMNLLRKYYEVLLAPEDGGGTAPPSSAGATSPSSPQSASGEASPSSPSTPSSPSAPPSGTPTPSEAGAPSTTSPAPGGGEGFDFSSIFDGGPTELPVAPPATPPPAPQPAPPAQAAPAPATAQPPAQPATPDTATPQAPPTAEFDRYDPGMLARHLASNEEQALAYVAENVFKLSPQDVEALETNVVEAIPKLLARVFVKSQANVLNQLSTMVPMMIQRQTVAMRKNDEGADKFYARWPMIQKAAHGDLVNKYGAVYRQMHPNANLEQMIEDLGPMILMAARIPPQPAAPASAAPVNPAATRAINGRAPPPSPFVPAGSAAPASTSTAPEVSPWEAMFRQE